MKPNKRQVLTGLVATGVLGGALAGGGVALASTGSSPAAPSPAAVTASATASTPAASTPSAKPSATPTAPASGRCDGGTAMRGPDGIGGRWAGQPALQAAAAYLGISQDQLRSQLQSGKSLAAVATAKGKSVSGLKNALIAAMTSQINADTRLSAAQKAEMISEIKSHIDSVVNGTRPSGFGMRGMDGMGAAPGQAAPRQESAIAM